MSMTEQDAKRAFAFALADRPGESFKIAFAMWPDNKDTPLALKAASEWPGDPEVLEYQKEAIERPKDAGLLPDKYQAALEVLARARKCKDDEVYCKLMNLYCTIMDQISKPAPAPIAAGPVTNVANVKVILMPAPLSKEEWTRNATEQQRNLVLEGERVATIN